MARGKQTTKTVKGEGNHRKETKEERKARLKSQEEAREKCFKVLPYAGGAVVVLLIMFAIYVRSVPPKLPKSSYFLDDIPGMDAQMFEQAQMSSAQEPPKPESMEGVEAEATTTSETVEETAGEEIVVIEPPKSVEDEVTLEL